MRPTKNWVIVKTLHDLNDIINILFYILLAATTLEVREGNRAVKPDPPLKIVVLKRKCLHPCTKGSPVSHPVTVQTEKQTHTQILLLLNKDYY